MKRKYWIRFDCYECPICGRGDTYRKRVYTEAEKGYFWHYGYDWCDAL